MLVSGRRAALAAPAAADRPALARGPSYHERVMAVLIASDLGKDIAGEPLLRGVSFKLERRDRMTLSGRNGAGKTTLLRMLAGEASIDGGELVLAKGAKVALHDQRPPRDRSLTLRDYVLSGAPSWSRSSRSWRARAARWPAATRRGDAEPLRRRPGRARARRRLHLARPRAGDAARARLHRRPTSTASSTPSPAAS
jgi:ATPase subunit of ABC transporter with duplicated ATPase domains